MQLLNNASNNNFVSIKTRLLTTQQFRESDDEDEDGDGGGGGGDEGSGY